MNVIKKTFSGVAKKQCVEFGLLTILVTIFLSFFFRQNHFTVVAFGLTLITVIIPIVYYPFAVLWFGFSKIMSAISSRILLAIIFFILVTPTGLLRRLLKKDSLKINQFKKNKKAVMIVRDHAYTAEDLKNTY